jgi:hypothetical protein
MDMNNQPNDPNVTPGDGPGAGYVGLPGIIALAAYLLVLTFFLIWQLKTLWPNCDATSSSASTSSAPATNTPHTGSPDAVTGGPAGQSSALKLDRIDPSSGPPAGGEGVTLTGTEFKTGATVSFGADAAQKPTVVSPSKITASTPPHAKPEKVDVKVTNPDGSNTILPGGYTYGPAIPQTQTTTNPATTVKVTSVSPKSGDIAGGAQVQIKGDGFLDKPTVKFGDSLAEAQWKGATSIDAKTPAHAEGAVDVIVINTDNSSGTLPAGYTYDSCLTQCRSRLLLLVLLAGALGGCFHALRSLWMFVGNRSLKWSWTLMYVVLPINGAVLAFIFFIIISAGSGFFSQPQGSNSCFWIIGIAALVGLFSQQAAEKLKKIAEAFFTTVPPKAESLSGGLSVTSIDPAEGHVAEETPVKITGTGFTDKSTVTFGGIAGTNFKFTSPSLISINAPKGAQTGPVDVIVTDPGSTAKAIKKAGYTYT